MTAPAWFTAKLDQRLALIEQAMMAPGSDLGSLGILMTYLTEAPEGASEEEHERHDRTCDHCGTYCPPVPEGQGDPPFFTGQPAFMLNGVQVLVAFGVCAECAKDFQKQEGE